MLPDGVVRTPIGAYVLRDDAFLSRAIEREQRLDLRQNVAAIASFAHLIPEGGTVINAGAFLGDHALTYSQVVGPGGRVYAFEPHPVTCAALSLNMARLRNVEVVQCGLSDAQGLEWLNFDEANAGGSFFSSIAPVVSTSSMVEVTTIDAFFGPHKLSRCDLIHLDAEGFEPRVLRGARQTIGQFHPTLVVEVCGKHLRRAGSSEAELTALLRELGYRMTPIPDSVEPELRDDLCTWGGA